MMSDPALKGKVIWLLMTARIDALSPDIRRPGRAGDLIIPVLDPVDEDRKEFIQWILKPVANFVNGPDMEILAKTLDKELAEDYSAAAFTSLRSHLKATIKSASNADAVMTQVHDLIPPDIGKTRQIQNYQAMLNCTRLSLLPDSKETIEKRRDAWVKELESLGVR
jgi:SpoVK/Ycf46/Vps4 family AAA+-type ATPase